MLKPYLPVLLTEQVFIENNIFNQQPDYIIGINMNQVPHINSIVSEFIKIKQSFIFYIDESLVLPEINYFLEDLISFFFWPTYFKENFNPTILVTDNLKELQHPFFSGLKNLCLDQGFKNLNIIYLSQFKQNYYEDSIPIVTTTTNTLPNVITILNTYLNSGVICFSSSNIENAKLLEVHFWNTLLGVMKENIGFEKLINKIVILKDNYIEEKNKNILQDEQIKNYASFLELAKFKYKDDFNLLQQFYNQEYEVLPLWYKRFGHIIKAFIGKRTWKSLIDS